MKVYVDPNLCIGCGMCTQIAPDVFRMGEQGYAVAAEQPEPQQQAKADEAAESCPVAAIGTEE